MTGRALPCRLSPCRQGRAVLRFCLGVFHTWLWYLLSLPDSVAWGSGLWAGALSQRQRWCGQQWLFDLPVALSQSVPRRLLQPHLALLFLLRKLVLPAICAVRGWASPTTFDTLWQMEAEVLWEIELPSKIPPIFIIKDLLHDIKRNNPGWEGYLMA